MACTKEKTSNQRDTFLNKDRDIRLIGIFLLSWDNNPFLAEKEYRNYTFYDSGSMKTDIYIDGQLLINNDNEYWYSDNDTLHTLSYIQGVKYGAKTDKFTYYFSADLDTLYTHPAFNTNKEGDLIFIRQ